jgi:hypothetical protein
MYIDYEHEVYLGIEDGDVSIEATGLYDADGELVGVRINGEHLSVLTVKSALVALGLTEHGWTKPLCGVTLTELEFEQSLNYGEEGL